MIRAVRTDVTEKGCRVVAELDGYEEALALAEAVRGIAAFAEKSSPAAVAEFFGETAPAPEGTVKA